MVRPTLDIILVRNIRISWGLTKPYCSECTFLLLVIFSFRFFWLDYSSVQSVKLWTCSTSLWQNYSKILHHAYGIYSFFFPFLSLVVSLVLSAMKNDNLSLFPSVDRLCVGCLTSLSLPWIFHWTSHQGLQLIFHRIKRYYGFWMLGHQGKQVSLMINPLFVRYFYFLH